MEARVEYNVKRSRDQLDGEPAKWYDRFARFYLPLGAGRSVFAAYKEFRLEKDSEELPYDGCNANWYSMADTWSWEARAKAYDSQELAKWLEGLDDLKEQVKKERIAGLLLLLRKSDQGLRLKDDEALKKEGTAALSQAKKTAVRELREELDGYSSKQLTQVDIIIKELPSWLQETIKQALG